MKIYMIRHGETDWNKKRKLQGQVDIPLNEFGKLLAKETAPALADVPFAVCYTSPLKREAETARLVLGDREVPIVPEVYQPPKGGESFEEVRARLKNFLEELYQKEELQDKNVLLSTHGAALCGILSLMKGLPISGYWQQGVHKNCAVSIAEVKDGKIEILQENVTYYKESVQDW